MIKNSYISLALFSLMLCLACKTTENQQTRKNPAQKGTSLPAALEQGFITSEQLRKPDKISQITAAQIAGRMNSLTSVVYNEGPDSLDSASACEADILASGVVVAEQDRVSVDLNNQNLATCLNQQVPAELKNNNAFVVNSAKLRLALRGWCGGGDVAAFAGKTLRDISGRKLLTQFCQVGDRFAALLNVEVVINATLRSGTSSVTYDSRTISGMMSPSGGACVATRQDKQWRHDACQRFEIVTFSNILPSGPQVAAVSMGEGSYYLAESNNLVSTMRSRYYDSGVTNIEVNNWRGQIRYRGGSMPPSWSVTSAEGGSMSGEFVPFSAASLRLSSLARADSFAIGDVLPQFIHLLY